MNSKIDILRIEFPYFKMEYTEEQIFEAIMKIRQKVDVKNISLDYLGNLNPDVISHCISHIVEPIIGLETIPGLFSVLNISAISWNKIVFTNFGLVSLFSNSFMVNIGDLTVYTGRRRILEDRINDERKWVVHFRMHETGEIKISGTNLLKKDVYNHYLEGSKSKYISREIIDNKLINSGNLTKAVR